VVTQAPNQTLPPLPPPVKRGDGISVGYCEVMPGRRCAGLGGQGGLESEVVFKRRAEALGIDEVLSARQSPWQNPFVERVIRSIRRECTDHIIALGERHLLRVLREYVEYYNKTRTHLSLDRNAPEPRRVAQKGGEIVGTPVLGGLHYRYERAA
jgi:hypothetical protein